MLTKSAYKYFGTIVMLLMVVHCKKKDATTESELAAIAEAKAMYNDADFKAFYDRFGKDSVFQMEHITFPLEGKRRLLDSLDVVPDSFRWERRNWILHKTYDENNESFLRSWADIGGRIVVEKIQDNSGRYTMERRFGKLSSGWHLIYYEEMGIH